MAQNVGMEIGHIVSDLVVTGIHRGAYLVHLPRRHGDQSATASYNGFGYNLGNLSAIELDNLKKNAEYCYPVSTLSSGGHPPVDESKGLVSNDMAQDITTESVPFASNGTVSAVQNLRQPQGEGKTVKFRQTLGAIGMSQTYLADTRDGITINSMQNTPTGNYAKLSIGTRVAVVGNVIVGQFPPNNNNLMNIYRSPNIAT